MYTPKITLEGHWQGWKSLMPAAEEACLQRWVCRERGKEENVHPPHYFSFLNSFNLYLSHHVEYVLNSQLQCWILFSLHFSVWTWIHTAAIKRHVHVKWNCPPSVNWLVSVWWIGQSVVCICLCLLAVIAGQPGQPSVAAFDLSWGHTSCMVWFEMTKSGPIWICLCQNRFSQKHLKVAVKFGIPIATPLLPNGIVCGKMEISHWSVHSLCSELSRGWRNLLLNDDFAFVTSLSLIA